MLCCDINRDGAQTNCCMCNGHCHVACVRGCLWDRPTPISASLSLQQNCAIMEGPVICPTCSEVPYATLILNSLVIRRQVLWACPTPECHPVFLDPSAADPVPKKNKYSVLLDAVVHQPSKTLNKPGKTFLYFTKHPPTCPYCSIMFCAAADFDSHYKKLHRLQWS
jgi:hypothetical protein